MSVIQSNKIDFIGTDPKSDFVILTISDHLDWSNTNEHLEILQDKLNTYLEFYESGQLFDTYPKAEGKSIVIEIVAEHYLNVEGQAFFDKAKEAIKEIGVELRFRDLCN